MPSVSFGHLSKRKNSTLRPGGLSDSRNVKLKDDTSIDNPTFIITGNDFDYNYAKWDDRYYFVDNVVSLHNNLTEVSCILDVLATYKDYILGSTQFVSYSSVSGGAWLADTRIPTMNDAIVDRTATTMNFLFTDSGFYVLSVIGKNGAELWCVDKTQLSALLANVSDWSDRIINDVTTGAYPLGGNGSFTLDWSTVEDGLQSLARINAMTGVAGNAYGDAPSCIRSCIWVPFFASHFTGDSGEIYLGQFPTGITAFSCKATPHSGNFTINIPWHYTDYRRATCEDVYLYLPLVGIVALSSDNLVNVSALTVKWGATASDGCVAYEVLAGNQVIGTFGGQVSVNYPIGVSQQASAGQIGQSIMSGIEKKLSAGLTAAGGAMSGNMIAVAGGLAQSAINKITAPYDVINTALTRNNTYIGGIGGGAGVGLDTFTICYTVAHSTTVEPAAMAATMGVPTMKPLQLSSCHGFCQCVNAHVSAPAQYSELDAIDSYINSGFYIE